jgi:hypothetical protein
MSQATAADAQLILQLYDLRRESELRKARTWWGGTFLPNSVDDILKVMSGPAQEYAWFRQAAGYWEMAASLVLHGTLNEELFYDSNGEMWFILAKVYPFLNEYREKTQSPFSFALAEKLATKTDAGRARLQHMVKMHEGRRKAAK